MGKRLKAMVQNSSMKSERWQTIATAFVSRARAGARALSRSPYGELKGKGEENGGPENRRFGPPVERVWRGRIAAPDAFASAGMSGKSSDQPKGEHGRCEFGDRR